MKRWARVAGLLCVLALMVSAQPTPEKQGQAEETQTRGYWIDPSTGLMWAGKDNGKDVSWKGAMKYCRDLRLAGYSDWRLASLEELRGVYDKDANAPGLAGPNTDEPFTRHIKGNLFLTGIQWSSTQVADDHGRTWGFAWRFDFNEGREFDGDELWFHTNKRALCVRDSGSAPSVPERQDGSQETQKRGYWIDPSTGLMWAGKDSGKGVTWPAAMEYCRDLRLAGYSDWRLATLEELKGIYDKDAKAPGQTVLPYGTRATTWHVKGNLFLTGDQWSSTRLVDNRGQPRDSAWYFDFFRATVFDSFETSFYDIHSDKRALCVRDAGK